MPLTRDRKIARAITILQRGRDQSNEEAGGIAPVVQFTRYEVNEMITLLLDAKEQKKPKRRS